MSQFIFISRLRQCLAGLPEEEIDRAVEYYEDYFADAKESEEEIIKRLGSPEEIAENIRSEILGRQTKLQEEQGVFTERGFETKEDRERYQEIDKFTQIVKNSNENSENNSEARTSGYYQAEDYQSQNYYQKENSKNQRKEDYYDDKKERKKNRRFITILVAVFGTIWMCILLCIIAVYMIFFAKGDSSITDNPSDNITAETVVTEGQTASSFTGTSDIVPEQNIKGLDIEIGTGNVIIETGDQFSASITKNPNNAKLKSSVEKGIWKIEEKSKSKKGINLEKLKELINMTENNGIEIVITVPQAFDAEKIKMEIAAGTLRMVTDGLTTEKADIEVAAGNIEISSITVIDEADIEVGMGSVTIELGDIHKLDIECDMGDVFYQGFLTGKSKIECNMGSVSIDLENSMSDYTFEWETGMGTVEINGDSHGGISSSGVQGNGDTKVQLEANMGSIVVTTGNGFDREKELSESSNSTIVQEDTYVTSYDEETEENIAQMQE